MNPVPSAIIFVSDNASEYDQSILSRQLFIDETMSSSEFDARISEDPNYPNIVHENGLRIMVVKNFQDLVNRPLADMVLFIKHGLASVESNKYGPPGATFPIDSLYWDELIFYPPQSTHPKPNPNVQDNIYYPLFPDESIKLGPFGTDPTIYCPIKAKGSLIE